MFKQDIKNDLNKAIKGLNESARSALRMFLAAVLNKEKELQKKELTEDELMAVLLSEVKKRKESIKEFEKAKRDDLVDKEKKELEALNKYLPEQLSEEEIRSLVEKAIKKTKVSSIKEMGKVMAVLMPDVKGKADGNEISRIVKELLGDDRD